MKPYVLISEKKKEFKPLPNKDLVYYHSPCGYMTQDLFYRAMEEAFVKYVENVRSYYGLQGRRAALVVDGHISRFTVRTITLFMEHNIDCIILPSHSSHVVQPLDVNLNDTIKRTFQNALIYVKPVFPLKEEEKRGVGRPPKSKRKINPESLSNEKYEEYMKQENAALLRGRQETPDQTQERVGRAKYVRAKIVCAIVEALSSLRPFAIQSSWNKTHLYPYYGTPNYTKEKEESLLRQIPKADRDRLLSRMKEDSEGIEVVMEEKSQDTVSVVDAVSGVGTEGSKVVPRKATRRGRPSKKDGTGKKDGSEKSEKSTSGKHGTEKKRIRLDSTEDKENTETNSTGKNCSVKTKKRRRRGPSLFCGLLTCPESLELVRQFETKKQDYSVTTSTITVNTVQGPVVVTDSNIQSEMEVADPKDYFTVLSEDANRLFRALPS